MSFTSLRWASALLLGATVVAGACKSSPDDPKTQSFLSDDPGDSVDDAGSGGGGGSGPFNPQRSTSGIDVLRNDGGRLYALSSYGGLSIVDASTPDHLTPLGRYRSPRPLLDVLVRGSTAYLLSVSHEMVCETGAPPCQQVSTSHVEALDVHDPAHVTVRATRDLPGMVAGTHLAGDVLYVVSYDDQGCADCGPAKTTLTALDVHDPAQITVADELAFAPANPADGWWQRSVMVAATRMYIAGAVWDGQGDGHTEIQIVDLSDPTGHLTKGAVIQAQGVVERAAQLQEEGGVLRVIAQPGVWSTLAPAVVQTWAVAAPGTALGAAPLATAERLLGARFDGPRAFALTEGPSGPRVVAIDLQDPAHPALGGELPIPGVVSAIEPRGDRLVALAYEPGHADGGLAVSLVDVAAPAAPALLSQAHFAAGDWSSLPRPEERAHAALFVDDATGSVFVPYSTWSYTETSCGTYQAGVEVVDLTHDAVTARGLASGAGTARGAFVHGGRLFGHSDGHVSTFDISDRDHPAERASVPLAMDIAATTAVGDHIVRLRHDWWTGAARIEVVPASDPGAITPVGALALSDPAADPTWCMAGPGSLLSHGDQVYVLRRRSPRDSDDMDWVWGDLDVTVVDVSAQAAPARRGQASAPYRWGHRLWQALVWGGEGIVQVGSTIVVPDASQAPALSLIDLADADQPVVTQVELPEAEHRSGFLVSGTDVLTSRWAPVPDQPGKVRFSLDRISVADPAAATVESVEVPGSLVAHDEASGRFVTASYAEVSESGVTREACRERFGALQRFSGADGKGTCTGLHRTLHLIEIQGGAVTVLGEAELPDDVEVGHVLAGADRVFLWGDAEHRNDAGQTLRRGGLHALGGLGSGALTLSRTDREPLGWSTPHAVVGAKLVLTDGALYDPYGLSVADTTDLSAVTFERKADLHAPPGALTMVGDVAVCSLGLSGIQTVDLSP